MSLLEIDGKDVNVRFREEVPAFNRMLMSFPVGSKVEALVSRDGKLVAKVKVRAVERDRSIANVLPGWKLTDVYEGDVAVPKLIKL